MTKDKLFILTGPTASGKTAVSVLLAKLMDAEIISADAIQLYKWLNIGSAKPTVEERQGIEHHLIDCIDPHEPKFTVSCFRDAAIKAAEAIIAKGKRPLVVGGTGLYINALTYPLSFSNIPPNEELRSELLAKESEEKGYLYKLLTEKDKKTADRLHPNDTKRIVRALEMCIAAGIPASEQGPGFTHRDDDKLAFMPVMAAITMPREMLYARIEKRVDMMFDMGLIDEVKGLIDSGCTTELPAMQGLGYKETAAYLCGECTLEEAKETIKRETRRFAKRQLTWFRREERIRWFDASEYNSAESLAGALKEYYLSEE